MSSHVDLDSASILRPPTRGPRHSSRTSEAESVGSSASVTTTTTTNTPRRCKSKRRSSSRMSRFTEDFERDTALSPPPEFIEHHQPSIEQQLASPPPPPPPPPPPMMPAPAPAPEAGPGPGPVLATPRQVLAACGATYEMGRRDSRKRRSACAAEGEPPRLRRSSLITCEEKKTGCGERDAAAISVLTTMAVFEAAAEREEATIVSRTARDDADVDGGVDDDEDEQEGDQGRSFGADDRIKARVGSKWRGRWRLSNPQRETPPTTTEKQEEAAAAPAPPAVESSQDDGLGGGESDPESEDHHGDLLSPGGRAKVQNLKGWLRSRLLSPRRGVTTGPRNPD